MSHPKWPMVPLGEVVRPVQRPVEVEPGTEYRTLGVKWWGEGAYERQTIDGSATAAKTLNHVRTDDLIINKIWVRNGSVAVVSTEVNGCVGSNEFPTFEFDKSKLLPAWMHWYSKTRELWTKCELLSQGTSGKNRIRPEAFLRIEIPVPSIQEQVRVIRRIDSLADKLRLVDELTSQTDQITSAFLASVHSRLAAGAPRCSLERVAPLCRRPATIEVDRQYPQVSVRSFGRGTFHSDVLSGANITWQKPYLVQNGDILMSNIKAWEGAIAVAQQKDHGRFGSHRYLTFAVKKGVATPEFLVFFLLSEEGLFHIGEASPGSADRNRTTSARKVCAIPVPVPNFEKQKYFSDLLKRVSLARELREKFAVLRSSMLPSILDRAFKGEL
ncbi:restriction modification system DNA specificity domain-containing protein [Rhodopirellula maiorica SM1]|uniref:Restriction modification system DNA specificity domain-containing protein n=1 Tax=Rhodopirellula maiorica SM1 TaxID=1265738 RepID=M5R892_9BACT|nr:restriction endonuclease subunit S [Rhodopirellula maiorica]EMI15698.1 restriction modification system DNA specificity domain-containing protein [Rhodopirellula maiorica SM1]